jgi:ribosomal protein S18 acetylase RimI-like enzyme
LAYYTLASASVLLDQLPSAIQKKLPRYAAVPAVRMGRLAVDKSHRQKGLGSALLADALTRACRSEITAFALIVDAKDHEAIQFYRHHGFMSLSHQGQSLFLPLASASGLVHSKRVGS